MSFYDDVVRARTLLGQHGRVSLTGLKRELGLDEAGLSALVEELVDVQQVAVREGVLLIHAGRASVPAATPAQHATAERRQLTVLFCDLVDSTRLAAGLDPEDWRDVVVEYQRAMDAVIRRFDGHIAQYLGDGILAYFGYPRAHEDDAERAVRAGLAMIEALAPLNGAYPSQGRPALSIRIGIHTGPVVVGAMGSGGRTETLALGETTNIAARLQGEADADAVVMSPSTSRLVQGIFVTHDLGERRLKGITEPVRVTRAVRPSGMRSRLDVAAATGLTPLVGRTVELEHLAARFSAARSGSGHAILLSGDAGIGKSRLVQAFRESIAARSHSWLECRASPYTTDSAFLPVLELQRQGFGFQVDDDIATKIGRLEASLRNAGFDPAEVMPLAVHFHSLPLPDRYTALDIGPEGVRRRTLDFLCDWLLRVGRAQSVVLLIEDLHWIDPSTLELLGHIIARLDEAPILMIATHRPEFAPSWEPAPHITTLRLTRLAHDEAAELVRGAARDFMMSDAWVEEVVRRSDGVPLFAEELTRAVAASAARPNGAAGQPRIPDTLQDSLMARLDALGPVKELAQVASVLGREFDDDMLRAVVPLAGAELDRALETAVREELFYQRHDPPHSRYLFKHALIRDAAYQSMVRPVRRNHHRRVAEALLERSADIVESQPELLAFHFEEADRLEEAVYHYRRAGELTQTRSAHREAIQHLQRALDVFLRLPDAGSRPHDELGIRIALGNSAQALYGFAGEIVREQYEQAARVSRALDATDRVYAVRGLAVYQAMTGSFGTALDTMRELEPLADQIGPAERATIANLLGLTHYQLGDLQRALDIFEGSVAAYDPTLSAQLIARSGIEVAITTIGWAAQLQWVAGRPDRAAAHAQHAVARAREVEDPLTLVFMLVMAATVATICGRIEFGRSLAQEGLELSDRHGIPYFGAYHRMALAWSEPASAASIQRMQQALADASSEGAVTNAPFVLSLLADLLHRAGAFAEALGVLQMANGMAQQFGMHFWDAELRRQEAEARQALDPGAAVEPLYREAIAIARAQGARSLELRAATSFARSLQRAGRAHEAHELLAPLHASFTEGLDTADVLTARALLARLA